MATADGALAVVTRSACGLDCRRMYYAPDQLADAGERVQLLDGATSMPSISAAVSCRRATTPHDREAGTSGDGNAPPAVTMEPWK